MSNDLRFIKACRREPVDRTPVWFMRQAGRYMAEYRKLREKHSILELCRNPQLAAEVTMQPINRFDLDAAIIFADILLPLPVMGVDFEFAKGEGPRVHHPIREPKDIESLGPGDPENELSYVFDSLKLVRKQLPSHIALIGFAGAPFTLASYMIEGGHSRNFIHTKQLMYHHPKSWHALMEIVVEVTSRYLKGQIQAGAQALQLFDSWIGALGPDDYQTFVLPHSRAIFQSLKDFDIPTIHFGTGTSGFLSLMKEAGGTVQSIDWRIPLDRAWEEIGYDRAIQGNLDPLTLLGDSSILQQRVHEVLDRAGGRQGHIFNLGHGFIPQTPVPHVEKVVDWVHAFPVTEK